MIEMVWSPLFGVMRVLAVVAHVDPPRILADADDLDHLILAGVDHSDHAQIAVRGEEKVRSGVGMATLMPLISPSTSSGSSFAIPGCGDLDPLEQLVALHVDDADPVRAVVADVGLRAVGREGYVERLGETREWS